jgi:ATP-dependent helicase/nuclease subunit A
MSETSRERANRLQQVASDPLASAFVAASAGSGKTKLLTDRLLRLMLTEGCRPERIQCLTFTKAAAAEMQVRLQRTLGRWVTMPDEALCRALGTLQVEPTPETCRVARALFARVLDLPGGMRIGTIHAFSQSLLRRFPLEAAISPHFQLVEDRDAAQALTEAREHLLANAADFGSAVALETLAGLCSADAFGAHVQTLRSNRDRLSRATELRQDLERAQRRVLGLDADASDDSLMRSAVAWLGEGALRDAARAAHEQGSAAVAERAGQILRWLSHDERERRERWNDWLDLFLRDPATPRGDNALINKKLADARPDLLDRYHEEIDRLLRVESDRRALRLASISAALANLAGPVAEAYHRHKQDSGLVEFEDLIGHTSRLLVDPGAAWVLYKLDGGLDHLLLDEVQDTSPLQWEIAHALTQEFFAGAGAREEVRTVFAVGDRKQSIYSFQGADTAEFDRARARVAGRVRTSGQTFRDVQLDVSFRSTDAVLKLVDTVFADPLARSGVVVDGETLAHFADRAGHAGLVELWPLTPPPDPVPHTPWTVPEQNQSQASAQQVLADTLAGWIKALTDGSETLQSRGRPVQPGDILVLVRRRNAFARLLVRALKGRGVPVAGLDRMVLTEQPAIQDLMALAEALLLPTDDLTLACVLTSPLGGLTDDDLMHLALERNASLWDTLRDRAQERACWRRAADFLARLLARVDYVSPYALFEEALGPLGGRARLFARLGPEAAEPIDELLGAALTYAARHPPSLQGFLHWLRQFGAEIKREPEAAGNLVRIMTVHGAKGLQAPIVVVPDTAALPKDEGPLVWARDAAIGLDVPLWAPRKEFRCDGYDRLCAEIRRRQMEEYNRLLYVALTRAEDRLLICGWQTGKGSPKDECWHSLVRRGFEAAGAEREGFELWPGELLRLQSDQSLPPDPAPPPAGATGEAAPPAWAGVAPDWRAAPPPPEPPRPTPLAPSRPEGAELGPVPSADSPLAERGSGDRFRRGQIVHMLLQHLPDLPPASRRAAAMRFLGRPVHNLPDDAAAVIADEVLAVMAHHDLADIFGPESRAEVPLAGEVGNTVIGGLVDRLAVLPDRVLVADFKTNRRTPARAEDTPLMYLRQMAAYRAILLRIFPGRPVRCALIWTREVRVSLLPDTLLDRHQPGAPVLTA